MAKRSEASGLAGRRVLVVEDEYFLADDMVRAIEMLGAKIVGPTPTKDGALALLASGKEIDAAVLDINLHGETVYPVADALAKRGIPFVFITGYDQGVIPPEFDDVKRLEKPVQLRRVVAVVARLVEADA